MLQGREFIVVDLDGTLIKTDLLYESVILLIRSHIRYLFMLPIWYFKGGRSELKSQIARRVQPDMTILPYNEAVLQYLTEAKAAGAELVLASASHRDFVVAVAEHLNIFDGVIGSDAELNCKGAAKLSEIRKRYPGRDFSYIGDSRADLPLWEAASEILMVDGTKALQKIFAEQGRPVHLFENDTGPLPLFKALRAHQWAKNFLLALPLFLAHQFTDWGKLVAVGLAFLMFSLCASAFYILNDLMDLEADRRHHKKKYRPFASGRLSMIQGLLLFALLFSVSIAGSALFINQQFLFFLLGYSALTISYSWYFKKTLIIDVIVLALFYTMRVFGGGVAADVEVTNWLLAFSTFFFLSLGFVKRYIELRDLKAENRTGSDARNYSVDELHLVQSSGIASGFISILVFFLYIANSTQVQELYTRPTFLWMIGLILLYWILRIWFLAQRGAVDSDPVYFAIRDRSSWLIVLVIIVMVVLSIST